MQIVVLLGWCESKCIVFESEQIIWIKPNKSGDEWKDSGQTTTGIWLTVVRHYCSIHKRASRMRSVTKFTRSHQCEHGHDLALWKRKKTLPTSPNISPLGYGVSRCTYVIFPSRIGVRIAEYHIKGRNDHFQGTKDQQEVHRAFRFCSFCILCSHRMMAFSSFVIIWFSDTHVGCLFSQTTHQ